MQFILWNPKDGEPGRDSSGHINTPGLIGVVGEDNVYISTYGGYPEGCRPENLRAGHFIPGVSFSLSGQKALYDVWRVS